MIDSEIKEWVKQIGYGTTSKGLAELIDHNDVYALIRIKHRGAWSAGRTISGFTQWFVCPVLDELDSWGQTRNQVWRHDGRLTNDKAKELKPYGVTHRPNKQ